VRWPGSTPFELSLSKPCSFSISRLFDESGAALSPRRATYFSLLRQRNLRKRKATLVSASVIGVRARIRRACGSPFGCGANAPQRNRCLTPITVLRCSGQPGASSNSPAAQTIARPDPSGPALLGAFTRVLRKGSESDSRTDSGRLGLCVATIFIAPRARITWARGRKRFTNRRAAWFWGSDRDFAAQHPQGTPQAWRIRALTPKTPESASSPDFNPQTPCGRAEQRRLGRTKILDVRRPRSGLVSKISAPAEQRKEPRRGPDFGSPFFSLGFFGEAKKCKSPAAATERHRNAATPNTLEATQVQQ
jgi:hypothetical protein